MEQRVPSSLKVPKTKRRRLKEFLRVEEIGSHINRVTGTLENIVFKGMEESEKEIRAKRMWFSVFALILLIVLGIVLSRRAQSEVAIFHPSACLGGWNGVDKAVGNPETSDGTPFSNNNSAILPENTIADLFCGEFKGEVPEDSAPKMLVLRIAWSIEGSTSTQVIQSESFASSTTEILDAPASTSPDFNLLEPSSTGTTSAEVSTTTADAQPSPQTETPTVDTQASPQTETPAIETPEPATLPPQEPTTPSAPAEVPQQEATPPQSRAISSTLIALMKHVIEKAYAQEESTTSPENIPIDTPIVIPEETTTTPSVLVSPINDVPASVDATPVAAESATSTDTEMTAGASTTTTGTEVATTTSTEVATTTSTEVATTTATTTDAVQPLFEILYSFDGTTWNVLGGVTLEQLLATQFQIPLPEGSSWGDLSKLQIHIKRVASVDRAPTIFLDAITLEVEVIRTPHVEPVHPDFERDVVVRDVTENGVRVVTIVNVDTQLEETWYMYLDESTTTPITGESGSTTIATFFDIASTTSTTTNKIEQGIAATGTASSTIATTTTATTTDIKLPQMKEKNVWKKYLGKSSLPTIEDVLLQDTVPSIEDVASTTDKTEEELILDLLPDLAADKIRRIKGVFLNSIIIQMIGNTRDELWLYDAENETQEKIPATASTTATVAPDYPFGIKGGFIFWLSKDKDIAYAYNPTTKVFLEQAVPSFDASKGERGTVDFPDISWRVIINPDKFTFYSNETGEVFSDEDSRVQDTLRKKFNLDTVLNVEKLNQLDFSIEKQGAEE